MAASLYSTIGAVAQQVRIPRWRLACLIERGDLPGPSLQVPGAPPVQREGRGLHAQDAGKPGCQVRP
jgi:hypothetical protein